MKIYISATYRDLARHRLAVSTALRRMGHQPIGMEEYVAEGMRPLQRCLADIETCDAFVGILAWRYGYVPKDAGIPPASQSAAPGPPPAPVLPPGTVLPAGTALGRTSITEFEFRWARQCHKPVLMFLLDPEADWPSHQFDAVSGEGEQGQAISRLRQEVAQDTLVGFFRSPEELAGLVSAAVYRIEMSRQIALEALNIHAGLNQPFIRTGPVGGSALPLIKDVIAGLQDVQALQIDLGQGREWWLTRLYFLASLAADLTAIEVIAFVGEGGTFIGTTNPRIVKERLAQITPSIKAYEDALATSGPSRGSLTEEVERRAELWTSQMNQIGGEDNQALFVTRRELERWLAPYLITQAVMWERGENAALQMQRLLDWPMRFVPVVEGNQPLRVVDKQALAGQVARLFVREQVARALSTFR